MRTNYEWYEHLKEQAEIEKKDLAKQMTVGEIIGVLKDVDQVGTSRYEIALKALSMLGEASKDNADMLVDMLSSDAMNNMAEEISKMPKVNYNLGYDTIKQLKAAFGDED